MPFFEVKTFVFSLKSQFRVFVISFVPPGSWRSTSGVFNEHAPDLQLPIVSEIGQRREKVEQVVVGIVRDNN